MGQFFVTSTGDTVNSDDEKSSFTEAFEKIIAHFIQTDHSNSNSGLREEDEENSG